MQHVGIHPPKGGAYGCHSHQAKQSSWYALGLVLLIAFAVRMHADHEDGEGSSFLFLFPGFTQDLCGVVGPAVWRRHHLGGVAFRPSSRAGSLGVRVLVFRLTAAPVQQARGEGQPTGRNPSGIRPDKAGAPVADRQSPRQATSYSTIDDGTNGPSGVVGGAATACCAAASTGPPPGATRCQSPSIRLTRTSTTSALDAIATLPGIVHSEVHPRVRSFKPSAAGEDAAVDESTFTPQADPGAPAN